MEISQKGRLFSVTSFIHSYTGRDRTALNAHIFRKLRFGTTAESKYTRSSASAVPKSYSSLCIKHVSALCKTDLWSNMTAMQRGYFFQSFPRQEHKSALVSVSIQTESQTKTWVQ